MGVRGLSTFMGQNPQLFKKFHLHDCMLVIDGNNLCHKLYHDFQIDSCLGGDYNVFHSRLVQYFEAFHKCNVTIYAIFDGAYDIYDRKLKTTVERAKQRLAAVKKASRGVFGFRTLPILALEVFRDVLIEMKIAYVHSDFEADDQIVALANRLQCPVLSQDSDFFIYDIPGGYIQLDSLNISVKQHKGTNDKNDSYRYLKAKIYYVDRLLGSFENLDRNVLPLYGAMLGNDFIDVNTFSSFFRNVSLPKKVDCKLIITNRQSRMFGLLAWLQTLTAEEAVEKVLHFLKKDEQKVVKLAILKGMENYNICRHSLLKHLGLLTEEELSLCMDQPLVTVENNELPEWFCQKFRSGHLPPFFLNALVRRRVFLLTQVEDWSQPNSYFCSLPIRQIIYGICLALDVKNKPTCEIKDEMDWGNRRFIREFAQNGGLPNQTNIQPCFDLKKYGLIPSLINISRLSKSSKLSLLQEVLKVSGDALNTALPDDFKLLLCAVVFWLQSVSTKVGMQFLNAVLLMVLHFYLTCPICKKILKKNKKVLDSGEQSRPQTRQNVKELFVAVLQNDGCFAGCLDRLSKFQGEPRINNTHPPDLKGLHWFAELQTCLLFSSYLNRLLDSPLPHFKPSYFVNGTFLYNAYQDLKKRSQPDTYLEEILVKDSLVHHLFLEIRGLVVGEVGEDCLTTIPAIRRKIRRKRKAAKKPSHQYNSNSEDSDSFEANCAPSFHAACELSNKYQHLNVDGI